MKIRLPIATLILPLALPLILAQAATAADESIAVQADAAGTSSPHDPADRPIRSRGALQDYLREATEQGRSTPFDTLSPGARIRVLGSISFDPRGDAEIPFGEDMSELDRSELRALLALFGEQELADYYSPAQRPDPSTSGFDTSESQLGDLERRYNRFYFEAAAQPRQLGESARAVQLQEKLLTLLPEADSPQSLSAIDDHDLRLLFRAADTAAFYATNPRMAGILANLLQTMEARGITADDDVGLVYRQLLEVRDFDQARRFAHTHSDVGLPSMPRLRDEIPAADVRPTTWAVAADGNSMTRTPVDLEPLQILVMAGCHFSEDAAREISADPVLGPVFRDHARWLMQPPGQEKIADVVAWNRKYPDAQAELVYDRADWPMLPRWVMPTYVIVKDGKVLDSANGWPPNPDRQHLLDMLTRVGLLPAGKQ